MIVLKEGECGGKRFRATFEEHIYFDYIAGREYACITKVQVQKKFLWFKWFITIKEWNVFLQGNESIECDADNDVEFIKNEAIELFDKIVNPYGA